MARSEYWSCPLRLPTPAAAHVAIASGVSQRVTSPRRTRARSYSAQFPDAIRCRVLRMHSRLHIEIMTRLRSRWSTCRPLLAHRAESAHQRRYLTPMASHTGPLAGQKSASGRRRGWTPARVKAAWSRCSLNSFSLRGDRHSTDDARSTAPQRRRADSSVFGLRSIATWSHFWLPVTVKNGAREHLRGDLQPSEFSPLRELPLFHLSRNTDTMQYRESPAPPKASRATRGAWLRKDRVPWFFCLIPAATHRSRYWRDGLEPRSHRDCWPFSIFD